MTSHQDQTVEPTPTAADEIRRQVKSHRTHAERYLEKAKDHRDRAEGAEGDAATHTRLADELEAILKRSERPEIRLEQTDMTLFRDGINRIVSDILAADGYPTTTVPKPGDVVRVHSPAGSAVGKYLERLPDAHEVQTSDARCRFMGSHYDVEVIPPGTVLGPGDEPQFEGARVERRIATAWTTFTRKSDGKWHYPDPLGKIADWDWIINGYRNGVEITVRLATLTDG